MMYQCHSVSREEAGNGTDEQNNVETVPGQLGYTTCKCLNQVLAHLIYT